MYTDELIKNKLKLSAEKAGIQVVESPVSLFKAEKNADAMKIEKKVFEFVTGKFIVNAPITSAVVSVRDAALKSARYGGYASAGYSIGSNTIELLYGEKSLNEAGTSTGGALIASTAFVSGAVATTSTAISPAAATDLGSSLAVPTAGCYWLANYSS